MAWERRTQLATQWHQRDDSRSIFPLLIALPCVLCASCAPARPFPQSRFHNEIGGLFDRERRSFNLGYNLGVHPSQLQPASSQLTGFDHTTHATPHRQTSQSQRILTEPFRAYFPLGEDLSAGVRMSCANNPLYQVAQHEIADDDHFDQNLREQPLVASNLSPPRRQIHIVSSRQSFISNGLARHIVGWSWVDHMSRWKAHRHMYSAAMCFVFLRV